MHHETADSDRQRGTTGSRRATSAAGPMHVATYPGRPGTNLGIAVLDPVYAPDHERSDDRNADPDGRVVDDHGKVRHP